MTTNNPSWQLLSVEEIAQDIVENKLDNSFVHARWQEYKEAGNEIMTQRVTEAAQLAVILGDML
jgi:hypothetical protein